MKEGACEVETLTLEDQCLTLDVKVTTPTAPCPTCAQPATRRHSRYRRTLADLPWAALPVRLALQVRRFFCDTPTCGRQTFTERVPTVARPYAPPPPGRARRSVPPAWYWVGRR